MAKLPKKTEVQSLAFCKRLFNPSQARAWAIGHGFRYAGIDETENQLRVRQRDPSEYQTGSFRTIELRPGVQAIIGRPLDNPGHNPGNPGKRQRTFGFEETGFALTNPVAPLAPEARARREQKPRALPGQREFFEHGDKRYKYWQVWKKGTRGAASHQPAREFREEGDAVRYANDWNKRIARSEHLRGKVDFYIVGTNKSLAEQGLKAIDNPGHKSRASIMAKLTEPDKHAARELELYIDNTERLYNRKFNDFFKNLTAKKAAGKYNRSKAPKLFMYLVEDAAKAYQKEIAGPGHWYETFDKPTRELLARELVDEFEAKYASGELARYVPKKYQKKSNPGHNPGRSSKKAAATVEEKLQEYARKRGTDLAVKKEKYGASNYVFYRLGERFDAAKSLADGKATIDRLVKAYPFIVKGSPTYPGHARPEPSTRSSSSAREPWRYPLSTNLGGAIHLVWSPLSQSYYVMWAPRGISQGNVLRNISDRREAEAAVDDLLSPEQRAHWRQKKPGSPPESKPSSNPGHLPGAKTIAQWKRIIRAEQPGAKFGLIVEADKDPRSGMPPGWIRINYSYKDMWGKQHAGREIPPELLKGGVMAKKKKAAKKKAARKSPVKTRKATTRRAKPRRSMTSKAKGAGLKVREKMTLAGGEKVYDADFYGVHIGYFRAKTKAEATRKARTALRLMVKK